ncbi:MAG: DUF2914 domain-containing protein [Desulfosarcina sp.]|jgi:transcriptional regulator with XRE-family HTH domain
METVGIYLKREREAINISLRDVAQITKITGAYLEYIEKNEFDKIPQGPYIKSYLSSYSRAIGCDVDHAIRLYESANRQRPQVEADLSAIKSIDARQVSAKPFKALPQAQASHPRWGKLWSWFDKLVSAVLAIYGSIKAAKTPIETSDDSLPNDRRPLRGPVGRSRKPGFSTIIFRWSTNRRYWVYASMAVFGAFILFLAAAGFYHLFLFDPGSAIVAEVETFANKENPLASDAGSRSSTVTSAPTSTPKAGESSRDHVKNKVLSVAAASAPSVSGTKPEADTAHATPKRATQVVAASSDGSAAARHTASLLYRSDASGVDPSRKKPAEKDSSTKQTIADASLKVSKATVCRSIENRMPVGVDQSFTPSDEKIYVWSMIDSRQGSSTIHHVYYFEGKKISDVSLDVRSTRWRTWSSKTIANDRYRGKWRVDITTSNGDLLKRLFFEVR